MRVIEIRQTGGPDVLEVAEWPMPEPGPGQVRVRHQAIGLNMIDTYYRTGLYPARAPFVPGVEAAGVVDAVGDGVTTARAGDRVGYVGQLGAYAEFNLVAADRLVHLPDDVSAELAAASLLKGMTAEFLVERIAPVAAGDAVLVYAAAGGVGAILTQWLARRGVRVIAAAGSAKKADIARRLGAEEVIIYGQEDVAERVRALTGALGVRVVYDAVGAATFEGSLASLGRRGWFISYGNASGPAPAVEPLRLSRAGSLLFTRPGLFDYIHTADELAASSAALFEQLRAGVKVEIGQRFALSDAKAAHEAIEGRRTTGSTILLP